MIPDLRRRARLPVRYHLMTRDRRFLLDAGRATAPLEREEERRLARLAGEGDSDAIDRLITSHVRFVAKIAANYRQSGVPMPDLVQEGMVGLIQAVNRFNPDKDVRLSTYAAWWIRAAIQDHVVRSWSLVRLGTTSAQKSLFLNLRRMTSDLIDGADALGEDIVNKLAERFETTAAEVRGLARRVAQRDQSLDGGTGDETGRPWLDALVSPEASAEDRLAEEGDAKTLNDLLAKALEMLPDREQFIIRRRYLDEARHTLAALGKELNLSKDRVRQLEAKGLEMLREFLEPAIAEANVRLPK